jgi:prevent-host-death family protein
LVAMAVAVPLANARSRLGELVHRARGGRERVLLTEHGKAIAAIICVEELADLESALRTAGLRAGSEATPQAAPAGMHGIPLDRVVAALNALDAADAAESSDLAAALLAPHAELLALARSTEYSADDLAATPPPATRPHSRSVSGT